MCCTCGRAFVREQGHMHICLLFVISLHLEFTGRCQRGLYGRDIHVHTGETCRVWAPWYACLTLCLTQYVLNKRFFFIVTMYASVLQMHASACLLAHYE